MAEPIADRSFEEKLFGGALIAVVELPELPQALKALGARLVAAQEDDPDAPLPWAVFDEGPDGDILGAGETPEAAIAEAVEQVRQWVAW
jgi:hypothetical protein